MADTLSIACGACGHALPAEWEATPEAPCPSCGSKARYISLSLVDAVSTQVRETLEGKVRNPAYPGRHKTRKEFSYGADRRNSVGDYVYKEREIDRDADRYRELVREESGEVVRDVEEPLSEHFGHGSAKFKVKPSDEP